MNRVRHGGESPAKCFCKHTGAWFGHTNSPVYPRAPRARQQQQKHAARTRGRKGLVLDPAEGNDEACERQ